jgi:iron-sulfur cluster repair protein YtfE (RIC family)
MTHTIIDALREDHGEVRDLFDRIESSLGDERRDLFRQLVGELVRHEVAEEEILRPVSKRDAGEAVANARIEEESRAEALLKEMEGMEVSSPAFAAKLATLHQEVEKHATAEETQEFPVIEEKEPVDRLEQMASAYERAKKAAPTRPHPSTPNTPAANMLVGPFAAVIDRARDAVRDAMKE